MIYVVSKAYQKKKNYLIPKRGLKEATNYRINNINYVKPQSAQARNGPKKTAILSVTYEFQRISF